MKKIQTLLFAIVLGCSSLAWAQSEQVNTTATQTLENKELTAPTITDPEITGTVTGSPVIDTPTLTSPTIHGAIAGSGSWDSPGSIGSGTEAPGRFSTLTATTAFIQGTCKYLSGTGSPEAVVTAPVCSLYLRTDGSTGTTVYVKESGVGNTGWVAVSAGGALTWTTPGTIGSATPNSGAFTTLSVTGQFSSSLSTGTAPFAISSTTKVSNLNVDLLDGGDWAAPIAIGTTTPAAGTFTTLTATTALVQGTCKYLSGTGSPEAVVTAPVCSVYLRTDGGAGTTIYSKEAGTGNVGWAAMAPSTINWAVPGTIGSTTPNTIVGTTVYAPLVYGDKMVSNMTWSTYGPTVAIDAGTATSFRITVTNGTAFAISNPTGLTYGQQITIIVRNASGGVMATPTWDTLYKMATFTKPADGKTRSVTFLYDSVNLIEINCSPEVPN